MQNGNETMTAADRALKLERMRVLYVRWGAFALGESTESLESDIAEYYALKAELDLAPRLSLGNNATLDSSG